MLLWALASPLGSVPDEPSHAIRAAAVVRGQVSTGAWAENHSLAQADVPAYVAHMHERTCFAFNPQITAACVAPVPGDPNAIVTTGTSAGINSPLYYAIVGLPTLFLDGDTALYGMRVVNALLCAAALAVMFMQLTMLSRSRWAVTAAAVALTPMVFFLAGSINPNALEMATAGALFATLVGAFRAVSSNRVLWERAVLAGFAVILLSNTRSIALLWVVIVLGAALALGRVDVLRSLIRKPAAWVLMAIAGGAGLAAVNWYTHPPTTGDGTIVGAGTSAGSAFVTMLARTFDFAEGYIGIFGWVDTPSPAFSVMVWSSVLVGLIVAALAWGSGRSRWVAGGLGIGMVLIPAVTQAILVTSVGFIWQGRYMLAILLCFLVACGIAVDDATDRPIVGRARTVVVIALALVALGQAASFVWTLRRYVVGSKGTLAQMFASPSWQPPLGWLPLTLLLLIVTAGAAFVVYRYVIGRTDRSVERADPPNSSTGVH